MGVFLNWQGWSKTVKLNFQHKNVISQCSKKKQIKYLIIFMKNIIILIMNNYY